MSYLSFQAVAVFLLMMAWEPISAAAHLTEIGVVDDQHVRLVFTEGVVQYLDDASGPTAYGSLSFEPRLNQVIQFGKIDTEAAEQLSHWRISSDADAYYGKAGKSPLAIYRKSKLNGMAQKEWVDKDYTYETSLEHAIYLALPESLRNGVAYTISIDPSVGSENSQVPLIFDTFATRSEAIHVNIHGYEAKPGIKSADLHHWMGSGGACDLSRHAGKKVMIYHLDTHEATDVGTVAFWKGPGPDVWKHEMIGADVYTADFTGFHTAGRYRLAIEGIGCSADFTIEPDAYRDPLLVSTRGYFYMRIGQDSLDMTPVPRRPLYKPHQDPIGFRVIKTTMHPYRKEWSKGGDRWDQPKFFAEYVQEGSPENPYAWGGHSDAADWDRHLGHVSSIYDLLLPYILTDGAIGDDDLGIAESGNGIPDVIDEARYEVDFWLRLRDGEGYAHGLSNAKDNIMYQAGATPIAAWANAANAAMLAQALAIAKQTALVKQYREAAITAYSYADRQDAHWLDESQDLGGTTYRGRDFKLLAAACLFDLSGEARWEDTVVAESVVDGPTSPLDQGRKFNQLYATAFYVRSHRVIRFAALRENMRASIIHHAKQMETQYSQQRPSRRSTDQESAYFHSAQEVQRSIIAHAVCTASGDRNQFRDALMLEADWGLGRNPLNMVQMTTATTPLADLRSVTDCYTAGGNDGTPGMHPGHTPYMNIDDWAPGMIMGRPSWMAQFCFPNYQTWPRGELFFNTRYVWAHAEFTPQQTMRGKQALYGYLCGINRMAIP